MVASRVTLVTHGFSDFHGAKFNDMSEAIKLVPLAAQNAEEHARADTQRNKQLFDTRLESWLGRRSNSMKPSDDAFTSYSRLE